MEWWSGSSKSLHWCQAQLQPARHSRKLWKLRFFLCSNCMNYCGVSRYWVLPGCITNRLALHCYAAQHMTMRMVHITNWWAQQGMVPSPWHTVNHGHGECWLQQPATAAGCCLAVGQSCCERSTNHQPYDQRSSAAQPTVPSLLPSSFHHACVIPMKRGEHHTSDAVRHDACQSYVEHVNDSQACITQRLIHLSVVIPVVGHDTTCGSLPIVVQLVYARLYSMLRRAVRTVCVWCTCVSVCLYMQAFAMHNFRTRA